LLQPEFSHRLQEVAKAKYNAFPKICDVVLDDQLRPGGYSLDVRIPLSQECTVTRADTEKSIVPAEFITWLRRAVEDECLVRLLLWRPQVYTSDKGDEFVSYSTVRVHILGDNELPRNHPAKRTQKKRKTRKGQKKRTPPAKRMKRGGKKKKNSSSVIDDEAAEGGSSSSDDEVKESSPLPATQPYMSDDIEDV
jgi:hypothetical protein